MSANISTCFFRFRRENLKYNFLYNRESIPVPIPEKNRFLLIKFLIFPSFYTLDPDPRHWKKVCRLFYD